MATEGFPRKLIKFGLTVQDAKGTIAATPTTVFPLPTDTSLQYSRGDEVLNWGDGTAYMHTVLQKIEGVSGGLSLPLIPDYTSAIADWVASEDTYLQGKWATLFFDFFGVETIRYWDVKVGSAVLTMNRDNTPTLALTLSGLQRTSGIDLSDYDAEDDVPYKPSELAYTMKIAGAALATVTNIHNLTINIDRKLESISDGTALAAQTYAEFLSNQGGLGITGSIERRMTDDDAWDDFVAGTLSGISAVYTRGGNSDTFAVPSMHYMPGGDAQGGPGDAIVRQVFPFTGLSSGDSYATAPFTWSPV